MSAVSSVGSGSSLYQFLQSILAQNKTQTPNAVSAAGLSAAGGGQGVQGAHHRRHHGGGQGGSGLFQQIQTAVTSALQSAQSSGTSSDPNQVIQQAIAQVLKGGTTSATGTATAAGPTVSSSATAAAGGNAQQAFFQALQSLGVTPEQFRSDFLAAVKEVQGGQAATTGNASSLLSGLAVDANA